MSDGSTAPRSGRGSVRDEFDRVLEESASVDEFAHGLLGFMLELARRHPDHPLLTSFGEQLGLAASTPLAAAAIHDLRSVLQGVTAGLDYAQLALSASVAARPLAGSNPDEPDNRRLTLLLEAIDDARSGAQLAAELAGETLQITRACMTPTPAGADERGCRTRLNGILTAAARLVGPGVELELRLETPDELEVQASHSSLIRVLINLLRNAAHAIDDLEDPIGAGILVTSWASDELAFVQVADDGPGIPSATLPAIFELFFTTHAEGTGVGLFVCQRLVHGWGGKIHVDSLDSCGARFTFSIPRAKEVQDVT